MKKHLSKISNPLRNPPVGDRRKILIGGILILLSVFLSACTAASEEPFATNNSVKTPEETADPAKTPELNAYERELQSMRVAGFDYIFVLKRKDGTAFTSEDKAFVREKKHYAANRFSFIEDERTLFIGSNYKFSDENLEALRERFEFKDFSKPPEQIEKEQREKAEKENGGSKSL